MTAGLLLLLSGFAIAAVSTAAMKRLAPRCGLIDHPSQRRVHDKPTPKGGGVAILLGTLVPLACAGAFLYLSHDQAPSDRAPGGAAQGALSHARTGLLILGAGCLLAIVGLIDDRRGLPVWLRLGLELLLAAGLFVFTEDVRITFFMPFFWMHLLVTTGWITGITNSFNLLDNMDGLSAGVALIVASMLLWVGVTTDPPQYFLCALLLPFIGSLAGFLLFNFHPASIFMGDCGSLFLGYFVAVMSSVCTFTSFQEGNMIAAGMPLLIMAVPLYDTATVVWIRVKNGNSIFKADKNHLSHRLLSLGFSQREAVLAIYLLTFCCGVGAVLADQLSSLGSALILIQVFGFLLLTALLERAGRRAVIRAEKTDD